MKTVIIVRSNCSNRLYFHDFAPLFNITVFHAFAASGAAFDRNQLVRDARAHIGIVSDRRAEDGAPLIIHNIGRGTQEENILNESSRITHYRYQP